MRLTTQQGILPRHSHRHQNPGLQISRRIRRSNPSGLRAIQPPSTPYRRLGSPSFKISQFGAILDAFPTECPRASSFACFHLRADDSMWLLPWRLSPAGAVLLGRKGSSSAGAVLVVRLHGAEFVLVWIWKDLFRFRVDRAQEHLGRHKGWPADDVGRRYGGHLRYELGAAVRLLCNLKVIFS